jgi:hypothetical protein
MDQETHGNPRQPLPDRSEMTRSPASGAARRRARDKGLAWVSAITFGAAAAGAIGAVAIGGLLPNQSAATNAQTASAANVSSNSAQASALQAGTAPTTSNVPPVATTGAS